MDTNIILYLLSGDETLFSAHKKGISSHQLARDLGVTQKTAWFMLHRLRETFTDTDDSLLGGEGVIVEADTTLVGGKAKNMHMRKRNEKFNKAKGGSGLGNKTVVAAYVERGGIVRFDVVENHENEPDQLKRNVETSSVLMTDKAANMRKVGRDFAFHGVVDHDRAEYVKDRIIHTNTVEGIFSLFDRMVIGIYHNISKKHTQTYCNESAFRYNSRKTTDKARFDLALRKVAGVRLKYETLIAK